MTNNKKEPTPNLSNKNDTNKSFEMPSLQVVLDVKTVKNSFTPIQKIEYKQINIQNLKGPLKFQ